MTGEILTIPGWTGSSPEHWMSHWEALKPEMRRVVQGDWDRPVPRSWVATLEDAVAASPGNVALIAHSLGVSTLQLWAGPGERRIACAVLVAPPDPDADGVASEIAGFGSMRTAPLPFPSLLMASRTDPYCAFDRAQDFARTWGSEILDVGDAGHINTASGFGPWQEGHATVMSFIRGWQG